MPGMRLPRLAGASWVMVAACASGGNSNGGDDDPIDAAMQAIDAAVQATDAAATDAAATDAAATDAAATDATVDAQPTDAGVDAPCTPTTTQILINPAFDGTPIGTGWVEAPYDPQYPLITPDDGIPEHTAPNKAWVGGIVGDIFTDASDNMYQQVTVPAGATALAVRGQYEVRTGETGATVYDTGRVELLDASNGLLETVLAVSNTTPTTVWTPFQRTFNSPYAGQAVRLRIRTTNDFSNATSFYFDTLFLEATVCP